MKPKLIETGILSDLERPTGKSTLKSLKAYFSQIPTDPVKHADELLEHCRRFWELTNARPIRGKNLDRESRHAMQKELAQLDRRVRDFKDWYAEGDIRHAALWAMDIGALAERIGVRPFEALAVTGKKIKDASVKGHSETHGTPQQKAERWQRYQKKVNKLIRAGYQYSKAVQVVAEKEICDERTIRRHTQNPARQKS